MVNQKVSWIKVWGIAGVQGAITLTWVIYNFYFPGLLVQFGLSQQLAIAILIVENALESIIEPVFGGLSDYKQQLFGNKISLISFGIVLSSALFIALPSLVIFSPENFSAKWLLPFLAVIWAGAMAIFRAPTMALLGRCATSNSLPKAASILTAVGGIIGAFRFDAFDIILSLGEGFAFALGSFSLLIAGALLRWLNPISVEDIERNQRNQKVKVALSILSLIFVIGIGISWSIRFVLPAVSQILRLQFGQANGKLAMTLFLILLGLSALPAGKIATKKGNYWGMEIGVAGTVVALLLLILLPFSSTQIFPIISIIIFFSFILNGTIPLAIGLFPPERSGLGVGMYFGGFGAGMASFDLILAKFNLVSYETQILGAIVCLSLVVLGIELGKNSTD